MSVLKSLRLRPTLLTVLVASSFQVSANAAECDSPTWYSDGRLCLPAINITAAGWVGQYDAMLQQVPNSSPARFTLQSHTAGNNQLGMATLNLSDGRLVLPSLEIRSANTTAAGQKHQVELQLVPQTDPIQFVLHNQSTTGSTPPATNPTIENSRLVLSDVAVAIPGNKVLQHYRAEFMVIGSGSNLQLKLTRVDAANATSNPSFYSLFDQNLLIPSLVLDGKTVRALFAPSSTGWKLMSATPVEAKGSGGGTGGNTGGGTGGNTGGGTGGNTGGGTGGNTGGGTGGNTGGGTGGNTGGGTGGNTGGGTGGSTGGGTGGNTGGGTGGNTGGSTGGSTGGGTTTPTTGTTPQTGSSPESIPAEEFFVNYADSDIARLLKGMKVAPGTTDGIPGGMRISSDRLFPYATALGDSHLGVAGRLGKGRLFFYGSSLMMQAMGTGDDDDLHRLFDNALGWLTEQNGGIYDKALAGGAKLQILTKDNTPFKTPHSRYPVTFTKVAEYTATNLDPKRYPVIALNFDVTEAEVKLLENYIRQGGSVMVLRSWWPLESYPYEAVKKAVAPRNVRYLDYPLAQFFKRLGLELVTWGDKNSTAIQNGADLKLTFSPTALDYWVKYRQGSTTLANIPGLEDLPDDAAREKLLTSAAFPLFKTNPNHPALQKLIGAAMPKMQEALRKSKTFNCQEPNVKDKINLDCEVLRQYYVNLSLAPGQAADATADLFPGKVASSERVGNISIKLDTAPGHQWMSTGLYAAPGETITITIPKGNEFAVQLGAHKDWTGHHTTWRRPHRVATWMDLKEGENKLSSPFGGLIYLVPNKPQGVVDVTIAGAARAAFFKAGETSDADWNANIKNSPAPWAELQGRRVIITVPAEVARTVTQPAAVMARWDAMADEYDRFTGLSPNATEPQHQSSPRQHRYVPDIDISAGYMHSGYPIMTFTDVPPTWVKLDGKPYPGGWGEWHELGHNMQGSFGWDGLGEVTNNIHSLNILTKNGQPENIIKLYATADKLFLDPNRDYDAIEDVFLKLVMFWQLNLAFRGDDFYTKMYSSYRDLGKAGILKDETWPTTSDGRKQMFMFAASKISGYNLLDFFDKWGLKPTTDTRAKIGALNLPKPPVDPSKCREGKC